MTTYLKADRGNESILALLRPNALTDTMLDAKIDAWCAVRMFQGQWTYEDAIVAEAIKRIEF